MVIVFVVDVYDAKKNGTTMTACRFAEALRQKGHTVRIVATGEAEPDKFVVPEWQIPIARSIAHNQGFAFAKPDEKILEQAMEGADIVHLFLPLMLEVKALKIARQKGIPCCGAFHLQPENITYIIHLQTLGFLPSAIYALFRNVLYKEFDHIHCPSEFIATQLRNHGYRAKLHVISNGVTEDFKPADQMGSTDGLFRILMTGRLSPEKRQDVLIDAIRYSQYAEKIQL